MITSYDDFKHQVKFSNPLVSVISGYVPLKKSGRNYVCCCPFHSEKTPSFHVNAEEEFYKCFGCGESGDVFSFIMKIENLTFMEALKFLANRVGLPMPKSERNSNYDKNSDERNTILEINKEARRFFYKQNKTSKTIIDYLRNRQLTGAICWKVFNMGYAPNINGGTALTQHLRSLGFKDDDIVKSGLAKVNQFGNLYDFFRNRIMIPITDIRGNVIAFGGRVLDDNSMPKYLNSPDTPVFKKSENLFSLNISKKDIVSKKSVILAEGYMDVIALYQAGFHNAVASLGTSLTPEQVNIIKRYSDEVIICYDSDNAGVNATNRAISLLLNTSADKELKIKVVIMENAKDPDEYIKKFGSNSFNNLLINAVDAIDFQLQQVKRNLNLKTNSGKVEFLKHSANILAQIPNATSREVYVASIARECNIEMITFNETVNSIINKNNNLPLKKVYYNSNNSNNNSVYRKNNLQLYNNTLYTINSYDDWSKAKLYEAERWILAYISNLVELIPYAKNGLVPQDFEFNSHRSMFKAICEHCDALNNYSDISIIHSDLTEEHFNNLLEICKHYGVIIQNVDFQNAHGGLLDCIDKIKQPKLSMVDGQIDLIQLKNKKLQQEKFKHKNVT